MSRIVVIGSSNVDYIGKATHVLIPNDSNLGSIHINHGGVGRNIVENLARLGENITFITALGQDSMGQDIARRLSSLGVTVLSPNTKHGSAAYIAIHDAEGDMKLALCNTDVTSELDIEYLLSVNQVISECEYLVIETNLDQEVIDYIFKTYWDKKIIVNGISTSKVTKIKSHLDKIFLLGVNHLEADILDPDYSKINSQILVITHGIQDIYYRYYDFVGRYPIVPVTDVVNATGAGDAQLSGIIYGLANNYLFESALKLGNQMATLTLKSEYSVAPEISNLII